MSEIFLRFRDGATMSMKDKPILYSFRRCPYAMRARMALSVSGQVCALREVLLRDKPDEMIEVSSKGTVPVLVFSDGRVIDESLDVMAWALRQADPHQWLAPSEQSGDEVDALIAENDGPFKHHLDRYKYPTRYESVDPVEHREQGRAFLETLDQRLSKSDYLFRDRLTFADVAIFPFIRQFANTDRDWFDGLPLHRVQSWLTQSIESPLFLSIMKKYPVWKTGDPEPDFPS